MKRMRLCSHTLWFSFGALENYAKPVGHKCSTQKTPLVPRSRLRPVVMLSRTQGWSQSASVPLLTRYGRQHSQWLPVIFPSVIHSCIVPSFIGQQSETEVIECHHQDEVIKDWGSCAHSLFLFHSGESQLQCHEQPYREQLRPPANSPMGDLELILQSPSNSCQKLNWDLIRHCDLEQPS